ncbi:MAG: MBOAT family O-acyltransferase [Bacilli bacterium]
MIFSSIPFIFFFLPICLIIYFLVPFKIKNYVLLVFSLIFYAWGEPIYILLMIFSSVVDYTVGRLIEKKPGNKKLYLFISIIINLGLLGFFKYSDFLINNINNLFNSNIALLKLGLPIGISFFTFQTMSYSIDVYRGHVKAEKNFFTFMTYVCMFPQLIAGPIVRYETVSDELHKREITWAKFQSGMLRFLQGLFKKVLIANNVGYLFSTITALPFGEISVLSAWLAIIAFTLQIYFDFSGYSDMAIGMGKMLGFTYPENFDHPFVAKSISEFWNRWHMSLATWFKDYLYFPLGGSRCKKTKIIRNLVIVWGLTGLWHGSNWNFIIWGLFFGFILILEKFVFKMDKWPNVIRHIYTLILIIISFWIFAFEDFNLLSNFGKIMFFMSNNNFIDKAFLFYLTNYLIIIIVACLFSTPLYDKFKERIKVGKIGSIVVSLIYFALFIVTIAFLVSDTYNPFLYFRF